MECFCFNDTATTEIYTLSLHDALPICPASRLILNAASLASAPELQKKTRPGRPARSSSRSARFRPGSCIARLETWPSLDRKSTRLNSSHANIPYDVLCLKQKEIRRLRP